jgi:hypothetical protein
MRDIVRSELHVGRHYSVPLQSNSFINTPVFEFRLRVCVFPIFAWDTWSKASPSPREVAPRSNYRHVRVEAWGLDSACHAAWDAFIVRDGLLIFLSTASNLDPSMNRRECLSEMWVPSQLYSDGPIFSSTIRWHARSLVRAPLMVAPGFRWPGQVPSQ